MNAALVNAARTAMAVCLGVRPGERVLLVSDGSAASIVDAFTPAASELGFNPPEVVHIPPTGWSGSEPSPQAAEAMLAADAVFLLTRDSLTHTAARRNASARGARVASMPGLTEALFEEGMRCDYTAMKQPLERWATLLGEARSARLVTDRGTDLSFNLEGRRGFAETGLFTAQGAVGNLPAGEAAVGPVESASDGILVVDGSMGGFGLLPSPLRLTVEAGRVTAAEGPFADDLLAVADRLGPQALSIAELGLGANTGLGLSGSALGDEKVFGTVHVALGNSISFGGTVDVPSHLDGIVLSATLYLDGVRVIDQGQWLAVEPPR